MKTSEIREAFLRYFEERGHAIVESSSLIPAGDPTLLFVNAGMVQFKDVFLGTDKRPYRRATTCQKCLRISGKHNDLENVGRTARHHTFFEMLGNFSFGDYFKKDAIKFGWEFLTEVMKLDKQRLWVTVFEDDDEAAELWAKHTDVFPGRILRFGAADNFWAMGETGPCGPCSEIHYYIGSDVDKQSEHHFRNSDGQYLEIWNLVFMQFNRSVSGELTPLPKPSVDTGMGLERISAIKQGFQANYDVDVLRSLIARAEQLSGKRYDGRDYSVRPLEDAQYTIDVAMRVAADHGRACSFMIADGINPSSDGRGYVLRRLIRRACRHGRALGFKEPFLFQITDEVIKQMGATYPELVAAKERIAKIIKSEEEKFLSTLDTGLTILQRELDILSNSSVRVLSGKVAFTLHDTYGFPLDLTQDLVRNSGYEVDEQGFTAEMELQRERSRADRDGDVALSLRKYVTPMETVFVGYEHSTYESEIIGLFTPEGSVTRVTEGDTVALVARETPFYAESGGQIGDRGKISTNTAALEVFDTQKAGGDTFVHFCRVIEGELTIHQRGRFEIDEVARRRTRAHHSATHLLHQALREVLGEHVHQAGSRVSSRSLRFDFSHFEPITEAQLEQIESRMNSIILDNYPVSTELLPIEQARKSGAMALFGEKYGEQVRVVQMGPGSRELCGGTHVTRVGDIGLVTVIAESGISAGVRRIEALAGRSAFEFYAEQKRVLKHLSRRLNSGENELGERVEKLIESSKETERKLIQYTQKAAQLRGGNIADRAQTNSFGDKIIVEFIEGLDPKQLREMADDLRSRMSSVCLALASVSDGKAIVLAAVTPDLTKRYHAGDLVKKISEVCGGRGGGKADLAQAGGGSPEKITAALAKFREMVA